MVVTDFKGGEQPGTSSQRTVASGRSGHRQTVPSEGEQEDLAHEMQDLPPPYEASTSPRHDAAAATAPDNAGTTRSSSTDDEETARMMPHAHSHCGSKSDGGDRGYRRAAKMTWEEKDASGHWARHDGDAGACCSRHGGCVFSDRGGCCFSDREACCFSDRDACCFSDRDACCFSDNGACCFSDNGACCFSGTAPGSRWRPVPSMGTLFKGLC